VAGLQRHDPLAWEGGVHLLLERWRDAPVLERFNAHPRYPACPFSRSAPQRRKPLVDSRRVSRNDSAIAIPLGLLTDDIAHPSCDQSVVIYSCNILLWK
jgi:hypothetical protein